jgi:hypothetical protein
MKLAPFFLHGLCATALLLSLAACGGGSDGATPGTPAAPTPAASAPVTDTPQLRCAP